MWGSATMTAVKVSLWTCLLTLHPGYKNVLHKRVSLPCAWRWSYALPALFDVISGSPWREGKLRQRRAVSA